MNAFIKRRPYAKSHRRSGVSPVGRSTAAGGAIRLCCVLFILYGCRLGGYLAYREIRSSSYKKNMTGEIKDGKTVSFGAKCAIWLSCACLYVTQV